MHIGDIVSYLFFHFSFSGFSSIFLPTSIFFLSFCCACLFFSEKSNPAVAKSRRDHFKDICVWNCIFQLFPGLPELLSSRLRNISRLAIKIKAIDSNSLGVWIQMGVGENASSHITGSLDHFLEWSQPASHTWPYGSTDMAEEITEMILVGFDLA